MKLTPANNALFTVNEMAAIADICAGYLRVVGDTPKLNQLYSKSLAESVIAQTHEQIDNLGRKK